MSLYNTTQHFLNIIAAGKIHQSMSSNYLEKVQGLAVSAVDIPETRVIAVGEFDGFAGVEFEAFGEVPKGSITFKPNRIAEKRPVLLRTTQDAIIKYAVEMGIAQCESDVYEDFNNLCAQKSLFEQAYLGGHIDSLRCLVQHRVPLELDRGMFLPNDFRVVALKWAKSIDNWLRQGHENFGVELKSNSLTVSRMLFVSMRDELRRSPSNSRIPFQSRERLSSTAGVY
ncbi:hypothetical protein [Paucibacter soli]|uniref:hypothetical protein n=1 Tax=Paucibacter soli TaxID=3133433 RepID=UPI0030A1AF18